MYHTLTIGSLIISMTGIGIVVSLVTFFGVLAHESSKHPVIQFGEFFRYSPVIIVAAYLIGAWAWYFTNELIPFPTSVEQVLLYISPVGREFSLIGITLGIIATCNSFLQKQTFQQRIIRIDIWFKSLCRALIPLGIFLLLGDAFIGMPTTSSIGISAIKPDSAVALYNKVLPLGLGVSLVGMIGVGFESFATRWLNAGHGYAGLGWIVIGLSYLTLYQQYARRILSMIGDIRFDIKQYFLIALAIYFFVLRYQYRRYHISHTA